MLRFALALALASFSCSARAGLEDCGEFLVGMASRHFVIDDLSQRDIEIDRLIAPVFKPHLTTALGRSRLDHLLRHPGLDATEIRDRQAAVLSLAENAELRRRLTESLQTLEAHVGARFERHFERIRDDARFPSSQSAEMVRSVMVVAFAATGGAAVTGIIPWMAAAMPPAMAMMYGSERLGNERKRYSDFRVLDHLLNQARVLGAALESEESRVIGEISKVARSVERPGAQFDLTRAAAALERARPGFFTPFAQSWGLTQPRTLRTRAALLADERAFRALASVIGELDVLLAFANLYASDRSNLILPTILDEDQPTYLKIRAGHHPQLWSTAREQSVPNSFEIGAPASGAPSRFLLLTGPNTGGKSTYLRMIAANVLLAQIGAPVPAAEMRLTPLALFTNKNTTDRLDDEESSFEAQCRRVADILRRAKSERHVLLLADEILTGTSPEEHTAIERALIEFMVNTGYASLLATHDRKLQNLEGGVDGLVNIHVDEGSPSGYSIQQGRSSKRNAIEVLRASGVDPAIVASARRYLDAHGEDL